MLCVEELALGDGDHVLLFLLLLLLLLCIKELAFSNGHLLLLYCIAVVSGVVVVVDFVVVRGRIGLQ